MGFYFSERGWGGDIMSLPTDQLPVPLGWLGRSINSLTVKSTFCVAFSDGKLSSRAQENRSLGSSENNVDTRLL